MTDDIVRTPFSIIKNSWPKHFYKAIVKFNGGSGALLCSTCRKIIAYGFEHKDKDHYCDKCSPTGEPHDGI